MFFLRSTVATCLADSYKNHNAEALGAQGKLKLVVPRKGDQSQARALWTTPRLINDAVRYYEQRLLWLRGDAYNVSETERITSESTVESRVAATEQARKRNAGAAAAPLTPEDMSEVGALLRQLYEQLVPAVVGKDCNAQAAGGFAEPLGQNPAASCERNGTQRLGKAQKDVRNVHSAEPNT